MADLYEITVAPVGYPVSVSEAKAYMKVTSNAEDLLIASLIRAATESIEDYTGQYYIDRTVQGDFDSVYQTNYERYPFLTIRRAPLSSVTSVQVSVGDVYVDESYQVKKKNHGFARLLLNDFNSCLDDVPYPLRVVFVAGYGAVGDVPDDIKLAIMGYVNFLYRNRNDCVDPGACAQVMSMSGFPAIVASIIGGYRIIEVYA